MAIDVVTSPRGAHFRNPSDLDERVRIWMAALEEDGGGQSLTEEARDMREAEKKQEDTSENSRTDAEVVVGALRELKELVNQQRILCEMLSAQLAETGANLQEVSDQLEKTSDRFDDAGRYVLDGASESIDKVQKEVRVKTLSSIDKLTKKNLDYIEKMSEESKKRIERLAKVTLPDRFFRAGIWAVLVLALFILAHIALGIAGI